MSYNNPATPATPANFGAPPTPGPVYNDQPPATPGPVYGGNSYYGAPPTPNPSYGGPASFRQPNSNNQVAVKQMRPPDTPSNDYNMAPASVPRTAADMGVESPKLQNIGKSKQS